MTERKISSNELAGRPLRLLFIGNSATYVHDLPQTLAHLATEAGYPIEATTIAKGGYELSQHANADTEHGMRVLYEDDFARYI